MRGGDSSGTSREATAEQIASVASHPIGKKLCRINLPKILISQMGFKSKVDTALLIANKALV